MEALSTAESAFIRARGQVLLALFDPLPCMQAQQEPMVTSMRTFYNTTFLNACDRLVRRSNTFGLDLACLFGAVQAEPNLYAWSNVCAHMKREEKIFMHIWGHLGLWHWRVCARAPHDQVFLFIRT